MFWPAAVNRVCVFVIEVCSIIRGNGIMNALCRVMSFTDGLLKRNRDYSTVPALKACDIYKNLQANN